MAKIIAVCGATGGMGGAVANKMLKELGWTVRAVARNPQSEKAQALKSRGAEVVYGAYDDVDSLVQAFEGVTAIFAMTNFWLHIVKLGNEGASRKETEEILNIAKAAAEIATLQHFVLHSLPAGEKVAGKDYFVPHCDSKDRAVDEIKRTLPELAKKSTFMFVGMFTQNLWTRAFMQPFDLPATKKHVWLLPVSQDTKVSFAGDAYHNVGVFVHAILLHPEASLPAKYVLVATDEVTMPEALEAWSEVTGKPAQFATLTLDGFAGLYGPFGREIGLQYRMHDAEADMMKPYRADYVTKEELGIQKADLIGHKQALENNREKLLT